ncbi:MAG: hypothetical protein RLZZ175_2009 [Bacteroidota bacterium]|jgi:hypothetical protein
MKRLIIAFSLLFTSIFRVSAQDSQKEQLNSDAYEVIIQYLDGTSETIQSEFYADEITGKPFLFKNSCERIYADQTKQLIVKNSKNEVEKAISFDNSWYFEVEELSGPKLKVYNDRPYKQSIKSYYFRKGDGPFLAYSGHNVHDVFGDNPFAYKYAQKHLLLRDIRSFATYGSAVGGLVCLFTLKGLVVVGSASLPASLLVFGGAIVVSSVAYPLLRGPSDKALIKAIKIYNGQKVE